MKTEIIESTKDIIVAMIGKGYFDEKGNAEKSLPTEQRTEEICNSMKKIAKTFAEIGVNKF